MISPMFRLRTLFSSAKTCRQWRADASVSWVLMLVFLAWDLTGWDMALEHTWGNLDGFALRDNWWMSTVMHQGARNLGWLFFLALLIGIWKPWGAFKGLAKADRVGVLISVVCALLSVSLIKGFSQTSCPWDLQAFGGTAPYVSHWNLWLRDGGGGHCFPAGHASTGFAFMAVYFGLRQAGAAGARPYLFIAMTAGIVLGLSQQMRGAHFMSHTLWTAWLCWTVGGISHHLFQALRSKNKEQQLT
jgi:membrane-associated PAP2 superfamily phosphatase